MANLLIPSYYDVPKIGTATLLIRGKKYISRPYNNVGGAQSLMRVIRYWNELFLDSPELSIRISQ